MIITMPFPPGRVKNGPGAQDAARIPHHLSPKPPPTTPGLPLAYVVL